MNNRKCKECNKLISKGSKLGFCKSCSHKGKRNTNFGGFSDKHRKNLSKACKGRLSAFKGKHHSKESKQKLSKSLTGKKYPEREGKNNPACLPEVRAKMSKSRKGRKLTEAWKNKIKKSCRGINKGKNNGMFGKPPKYKRIKYKNQWMRSSYEIAYAKYLDKKNIRWQYESKTFDLGNCTYTPDFYLPERYLYIEIKGYWREIAKIKFELFKKLYPNTKIKILCKEQLKSMEAL